MKSFNGKRCASADCSISKIVPTKFSPVTRKGGWTADGTEDIRPALTSSLFPNVSSTIHFTVEGERGTCTIKEMYIYCCHCAQNSASDMLSSMVM